MNPYYFTLPQNTYPNYSQSYPMYMQSQYMVPGFFRSLFLSDSDLEIDIYCDEVLIASNLKHANALNYLQMLPGAHRLAIIDTSHDQNPFMMTQEISIKPSEYLTLCIIEKKGQFHLYAIIDEVYPTKDNVLKLRMINFTSIDELEGKFNSNIKVKNLNTYEMTPYFNNHANENHLTITSLMRGESIIENHMMNLSDSGAYSLYVIESSNKNEMTVIKLKDGVI